MDLAFEAVGSNGKFQKIVAILVIAVGGFTQILNIAFPFTTKQPEFLCRDLNTFAPDFYPCHKENLCKPDLFEYMIDQENTLNNMALDLELWCDREYFISLFGTSFFFGGMFGSIFFSSIPDRKGREGIYKILISFNLVMHLNILFTNSPTHVVIINFLSGLIAYAMSMSMLIITEYMHRSIAGIIMSLHSSIFPLLGILVSLYFLFINNWRLFFFITSTCSLLMAYAVNKYFVESPRWLNSKNRMQDCLEALRKIAITNGNEKTFQMFLDQNAELLEVSAATVKENKKTFTLPEILRLKSQQKNIIYMSYIWMASGFCFYGLIMNLEHLGGNIFLNSIVTFSGEIFSEMLSGYLAEEFGRVLVLKISGFLGGIGFIMYEVIQDNHWMKSLFIFMTSFGFSGTMNLIYIYSPEVFPTSIRSTVMGMLYLISRFGALLVPALTPMIPHNGILFGILSILSGWVSLYLQETLGKELEDDVPESKKQPSILSPKVSKARLVSSTSWKSQMRKTIVSDTYFKLSSV